MATNTKIDEIFGKIKDIILKNADYVQEEEIRVDANLRDDFGLDSLDVMSVIDGIEREFGISIPDKEANRVRTVNDLLDCISVHL